MRVTGARSFDLLPLLLAGALVFLSGASAARAQDATPARDVVAEGSEAGSPFCTERAYLSHVAARAAQEQALPSAAELSSIAHAEGSYAPFLWIARNPSRAAIHAWLQALLHDADGPVVCGFAQTGALVTVVATIEAATLRMTREGRVTGSLAPAFHEPQLFFFDADGLPVRMPLEPSDLTRGIALPDGASSHVIQLVATGPRGPRPVAELRQPADAGGIEAISSDDSGDVQAFLDFIGDVRRGAHRPPLRVHRLLTKAANTTQDGLRDSAYLTHVTRAGAGPRERLLNAGVRARRVGEVVARASSFQEALLALHESPSHMYALLARDFTDVGISVAQGTTTAEGDTRPTVVLVALLASWPSYAVR